MKRKSPICTVRHYEFVADILRAFPFENYHFDQEAGKQVRAELAAAFSARFAEDNPRHKPHLFMQRAEGGNSAGVGEES